MKTIIKRLSLVISSVIFLVILFIITRTFMHVPQENPPVEHMDIVIDEMQAARNLAQAIRFKTISHQLENNHKDQPFDDFIKWVMDSYPDINNSLELKRFGHTMLYKWQGSEPALKPVLFTGHYDVVPIVPGTEEKWQHAPFSGMIADNKIWGRGAIDDKSGVIGLLEATTYLLKQGYQPKRTIYLSFGHDEELGGNNGAGAVADYLKKQNIQMDWSLDEGSFILDKIVAGIDELAAIVNVAEKGYVTLEIIAKGKGGHSSIPPRQTSIGVLARAITALEENPLPGKLEGLSLQSFDTLSRYMNFPKRAVFSNLWIFGGLAEASLSSSDLMNAMLHTTTAPTMLSGSNKENSLAPEAIATYNFRLHPRDTVDGLKKYVERVINDPNVSIRIMRAREASPVSSWEVAAYHNISQSIREIYGDIIITPGLMIAGSDTTHYGKVADNSYRFNPFLITKQDLSSFHGTNENISLDSFAQGIRIYIQLMKNSTG